MTIKEIVRCIINLDYATAMADAFRRAIGMMVDRETYMHGATIVECSKVPKEIEQCFKNYGSPMDGRHG